LVPPLRREIDDVVQAHHPNCFAVVDDREVCDPTFSKCVEGFTDRRVGAALISFSVYASATVTALRKD